MSSGKRAWCSIAAALYLDLPYIVDSIWRRAEFNVNRWFSYAVLQESDTPLDPTDPRARGEISARRYQQLPVFWLYLTVLLFAAYGPTLDAWCSIVGVAGMAALRLWGGICILIAAAVAGVWLFRYGWMRAGKRFDKAQVPNDAVLRRLLVRVITQCGVCGGVLPLVAIGGYLCGHASMPVCHRIASPAPAWWQLLILLAMGALITLQARRTLAYKSCVALQWALLSGMLVILWAVVAPLGSSEAAQSPYPNVYAVAAAVLLLVGSLARPFARRHFRSAVEGHRAFYRERLKHTELFPESRRDPPLTGQRVFSATATGVCYHGLHLLLLPSLFLLFAAPRQVPWVASVGTIASIGLLTVGNLTVRWQQMVVFITRWFLLGTPLVVSIGVILLAACRLAHVQYVTTVFDAAPFGVIFVWIVMTYALFWWFEYTVTAAAGMQLLRLWGEDAQAEAGCVPYVPSIPMHLQVRQQDRWLAPHGMGRFVAMGWFAEASPARLEVAFQSFDFVELVSTLTPAREIDRCNEIKRRLQVYYLALNGALALAAFGYFLYYGHGDASNTVEPVVSATTRGPAANAADLTDLLRSQARQNRPAYIVAASGGGTRAALYTASGLEGLARLGLARDIVLLSGVSGGGASIAYFYAHQQQLMAPYEESRAAWHLYKRHMTDAFIGDVLEGATEWRLVSRNALGVLLRESFDRQLFDPAPIRHMGDAARPALILNTTVTGHPQEDSVLLDGMFVEHHPERRTCDELHSPYAIISGGRLVFTNLKDENAFPGRGGVPDVRLQYVVVQDPRVELSAAAALNSNFPPVFTNARVTVPVANDLRCPTRSYYVTDGGATENLGLISALFALKKAVADLRAAGERLPELHLVLLEASATTYDYRPDRGINAASGGSKEQLTGGLTEELIGEIETALGGAEGTTSPLRLHDLAMPLAFRSRGGFGTHWMFPDSIEIENPRSAHTARWYEHLAVWRSRPHKTSAVLDRDELMQLWAELFDPGNDFCATPEAARTPDLAMQTVRGWVCGSQADNVLPDLQLGQWRSLAQSVR